jgi:hypothetical protein
VCGDFRAGIGLSGKPLCNINFNNRDSNRENASVVNELLGPDRLRRMGQVWFVRNWRIPMHTLCICYTLNPNQIEAFRRYVENELPVIQRSGGAIVGYFLPTDFAGPTNISYGLIDFATLADYEEYRQRLADDPTHKRNAAALVESGAVVNMERSIISRHGDTRAV